MYRIREKKKDLGDECQCSYLIIIALIEVQLFIIHCNEPWLLSPYYCM